MLQDFAMFLAAAVQLTSTSDEEANWESARALIERAAAHGARFVATPENTNYLGPHEEKVRRAEPLDGRTCRRFAELARRLGIHLLLGSFNERSDEAGRCYNTSVFFCPAGEILGAYRKIHLFDVDVPDGVRFAESATCKPGRGHGGGRDAARPLRPLDLLRPALRRALPPAGRRGGGDPDDPLGLHPGDRQGPLGAAGARPRHRDPVLGDRPGASMGQHDDGGLSQTWGHAMIVDPWGIPVATAADGPGLALAEIDLDRAAAIRQAIPVARHRRL